MKRVFDLRGSGPDFDFDETAGDRAVHERDAVRGAEAEMAGGGSVGGDDRRPPAAALLHEPVTDPANERACARPRQPLAVWRIRDDEPLRSLRPRLKNYKTFQTDQSLKAETYINIQSETTKRQPQLN